MPEKVFASINSSFPSSFSFAPDTQSASVLIFEGKETSHLLDRFYGNISLPPNGKAPTSLCLAALHKGQQFRKSNFNCDVCKKHFSRNYDLKRHRRMHEGTKPYACTTCERSFSRQDALQRHQKSGYCSPLRKLGELCCELLNSRALQEWAV